MASGRRQAARGKRQGRRQAAGGRRQATGGKQQAASGQQKSQLGISTVPCLSCKILAFSVRIEHQTKHAHVGFIVHSGVVIYIGTWALRMVLG